MFSLPPLVWLHTTLLLSPTVAVRLQQCSHVLTFTGAFLSPKRLFLPSCLFPLFSPWPPSPSPLLPFHWSILPASPKRENNSPPLPVSWLFPNLFNPIHIVYSHSSLTLSVLHLKNAQLLQINEICFSVMFFFFQTYTPNLIFPTTAEPWTLTLQISFLFICENISSHSHFYSLILSYLFSWDVNHFLEILMKHKLLVFLVNHPISLFFGRRECTCKTNICKHLIWTLNGWKHLPM